MSINDAYFMSQALTLARLGRFTVHPNPAVGCVIVRANKIIGWGFHQVAGEKHAEIYALEQAGDQVKNATIYITLEPCVHLGHTPPCSQALIKSGIKRAVIAMVDPNPQVAGRGINFLQQSGIEVCVGLMSDKAERLNLGFCKRMRTGRPYVCLKLAASLDGRTALTNGDSHWITSQQARDDAQVWRAASSAILSSSATILADNPCLTVRWSSLDPAIRAIYPQEQVRQPIRVLLDSHQRITFKHRVISQPGTTWLVTPKAYPEQYWPDTVEQLVVASNRYGKIDLQALFFLLGSRKINSVLVESGPTLAGALLREKVVDQVLLYLSPKLLGKSSYGLCNIPQLLTLDNVPTFDFINIKQIGPDLRIQLKPCYSTNDPCSYW